MHGIRLLGMYVGVNLVLVKTQKKDEDQMDEENTSDNTMPPLENIVEQPFSSLSFSISVPTFQTTLATLSNSLSKPPPQPLLMNTPPPIFPPFPPPCIPQDVFPCPPFPPPIFTPPQIPLLPPPPPSLPLHAVSFNTTCNITPLFSLPHPTTVISTPPISLFSNNVHALPLPTPPLNNIHHSVPLPCPTPPLNNIHHSVPLPCPTPLNNIHHSVPLPCPTPPLNNIHHSVPLPCPTPPLNNIHHSVVPLPCPTPPLLPPAYFSFSCDDNQVTEDVIISDEGKLKVEINKDDIENEREDETGFIEVFDYHHCPPINTPSLPPLNI